MFIDKYLIRMHQSLYIQRHMSPFLDNSFELSSIVICTITHLTNGRNPGLFHFKAQDPSTICFTVSTILCNLLHKDIISYQLGVKFQKFNKSMSLHPVFVCLSVTGSQTCHDPPASASVSVGVQGVHHHVRPKPYIQKEYLHKSPMKFIF